MNSIISKTENFLHSLEIRLGLFGSSFLVGLMVAAIAMFYVQPNFEVAFHGVGFSSLSENPFDFSSGNPLQYRILAPLLGYLLFLRGKLFFILPLLFATFLPGAVYFQYRKKEFNPVEAFAMTSLVAFSSVILIPLIAPAYTDTLTFFFLFLSFVSVRKVYRCALFFALALLNHESSVVVLPGLLLYSWMENKSSSMLRLKAIVSLLLSCAPYLIYRWYVSSHTEVLYSLNFYFREENIRVATKYFFHFMPAAVFYAFKLFWFFPLYALFISMRERKFSFVFFIGLIVTCTLSQLIIAFDYTRMMALAFPVILISAEKVRGWWGTEKFLRFSLMLIGFNFFILQYYVTNDGLTALFPLIYNLIASWCGQPNV